MKRHLKDLNEWRRSASGRAHLLFVLILLLLAIFNFRQELAHPSYIRVWKDVHGLYYYGFEVVRDSIVNYGQFPHWSVYIYAGFPFFAYPQSIVLYFNTILLALFPFLSIEIIITIFQVLSLFLSGLIMYIVLVKLAFKPRVAFVGAMLQMFSWYLKSASYSWLGRYSSMLLLPAVFYCTWKALHTKAWVRYSLLGGVFYGLQFLAGGIDMFLYTLIVFFSLVLVFCGSTFGGKRIAKAMLVLVLMGLITFMIVLVQFLPIMEFSSVSSQRPFTFEESVGEHVAFTHWYDIFLMFVGKQAPGLSLYNSANISWAGFILVLIGLVFTWKKKMYWFCVVLMILALLTVTGSPFYYMLWKYVPGFDRMHHVDRGLFLFTFGSVTMAVLGLSWLDERVKHYSKRTIFAIYLLITAVLFWQLVVPYFELEPPEDFHAMLEGNDLLKYLSAQPGLFRIHNFNTQSIAGHASSYNTPYRLQMLYGVTSVWIPEYFNIYLGFSHSSPAKFYGMLNTKFIYSQEPLNVTYLKFVQEFKPCEICVEDEGVDKGVDGPYLYENERFLPRAYFTKSAVLLTGAEKIKEKPFRIEMLPLQLQLMYQFMLDPRFEPTDLVLVAGERENLGSYEADELSRYRAVIVIKGPIDERAQFILNQYAGSGGRIIPNVLTGNTSISEGDIDFVFGLSAKAPKDAEALHYDDYTPNRQAISLSGEGGWVVLSEKYHMFEGWHAKIDGQAAELYKANGMQTAIYVPEGSRELELYYSSWRFHAGLSTFFAAILIVFAYLWHEKKKAARAQQTDTPKDAAKDSH